MSLILEALRKSEAERQIGRAPGLLTPVSMGPVEPSRRRGWLVGLLIALVALAIALAWWLGRNGQPATNEAAAPVVASAATPAPDQVPAVTTASDNTASDNTASAPATAIATARPVTRPLPAAGPADYPSDPDFESNERESLPLPAPTSAPVSAEPPTPAAPVSATNPPAAITAAAPTSADVSAPEPAPIEPPAISVTNVPTTTPLSALSEAERAGLPPLRLNMHVFNAEPSRRFVMIDGKRHAEGDPLAAEVKLVEIRREGAVVDIRGRLILIQRP